MLSYVLKRIVLFVPTLFVITLIGFVIAENAPGDPVERLMSSLNGSSEMSPNGSNVDEQKRIWRHRLGLDRPVFYFSVSALSEPDTLHKTDHPKVREAIERLNNIYGNPEAVSIYFRSLAHLKNEAEHLLYPHINGSDLQLAEKANTLSFELLILQQTSDTCLIRYKLNQVEQLMAALSLDELHTAFAHASAEFKNMELRKSTWKNYIPTLHWHGSHNRYHLWLFGDGVSSRGIFRGDFGLSFATHEKVMDIIGEKIGWSLFFSITSVLLAYLISIPLGAYSALRPSSALDRYSSIILFALFSLPVFFMGVLLLMLFANPDILKWFPASGVKPIEGYPADAGFFEKLKLSLPHLILPLICYTYSSLAFLSRLTKAAVSEQFMQDYIRTAQAKGLSDQQTLWRHAFRNALLPLITVFSSIFPMMLGGSVIIESIFTIPGMGYESVKAILSQDYPVIIGILTISGVMTLVGYLLADIAYSWADPRIQLSNT